MRILGVFLFLVGGSGAAYATWATYAHGRPRDVAFGLLSPIATLVMLLGLLLAFVPDFFG